MSTTASKSKKLKTVELAAALAAMRQAGRLHPHVAIRPQRPDRGEDRRSEGMRIAPTTPTSQGFNAAMDQAANEWPDANSWDIIGCGDIDPVSGDFLTPDVYGSFDTYDADGFSAGGGAIAAPVDG